MARLQNALRAYALEGLRPSLVLERMNGFAREVFGGPMATLMYGVLRYRTRAGCGLRPRGIRRRWSSPPTARPTTPRAPPGSPLGVVPHTTYEETTIPLVAGPTVLLYTDGLVKHPQASLNEGLEWLREFARGVHGGPDELCGVLLQERFGGIAPRDDVACSRSASCPSRSSGPR